MYALSLCAQYYNILATPDLPTRRNSYKTVGYKEVTNTNNSGFTSYSQLYFDNIKYMYCRVKNINVIFKDCQYHLIE